MATNEVLLYRYDVTHIPPALEPILRTLKGAAWHTSIVAFGKEYYFDGVDGLVVSETPAQNRYGQPCIIDKLGTTSRTGAEFDEWVEQQRHRQAGAYKREFYNVMQNNCVRFCEEASRFLVNRDVPEEVYFMVPNFLTSPLAQMLLRILDHNERGMGRHPYTDMSEEGVSESESVAADSSMQEDTNTSDAPRPSDEESVWPISTNDNFTDGNQFDLMLAQSLIETNPLLQLYYTDEEGKERDGLRLTITALEIFVGILHNIVVYPKDLCHRTFTASKPCYVIAMLPLERYGLREMIKLAGFVYRPHPSIPGQAQWTLSRDVASLPRIMEVLHALLESHIRLKKRLEAGPRHPSEGTPQPSSPYTEVLTLPVMLRDDWSIEDFEEDLNPLMVEGLHETQLAHDTPLTEPKDAQATRQQASVCEAHSVWRGSALRHSLGVRDGQPLRSFVELLCWHEPPHEVGRPVSAAQPRQPRRSYGATTTALQPAPRLLLCHDMRGGYQPADYAHFTIGSVSNDDESGVVRRVMDRAYTVEHWERVYGFVYFSHARVSVPPAEWIAAAHKHGALALATLLCEDEDAAAELQTVLEGSARTGAVLQALVRLCDYYGFDGYLLNIECAVIGWQVAVLLSFCTQLRARLNANMSSCDSQCARVVLWYDAVTKDGVVRYQNALTPQNEPFFNCCDGIFLNYFWSPPHLALSVHNARMPSRRNALAMSHTRLQDIYVGVDVFGRNMYGGGKYTTHHAVRAAVAHSLSVALFAPGWTAEMESGDCRVGFLRAERRLWAGMADCVPLYACEVTLSDTVKAHWTSFMSAVGAAFFVNGGRVGSDAVACWCQLSAAQEVPPSWDVAPSASAENEESTEEITMRLFAMPMGEQSMLPCVNAHWDTTKAWFGDRALCLVLPPRASVLLMSWYMEHIPWLQHTMTMAHGEGEKEVGKNDSVAQSACFAVDVVWRCDGAYEAAMRACALRVKYIIECDEAKGVTRGGRGTREEKSEGLSEAPSSCHGAIPSFIDLQGVVLATSNMPHHHRLQQLTTTTTAVSAEIEMSDIGRSVKQTESDEWCIVRYLLHNENESTWQCEYATPGFVNIVGLGLVSAEETGTLPCCIGGIAAHMVPANATRSAISPLRASKAYRWPIYDVYPTETALQYVLALHEISSVCEVLYMQQDAHTTAAPVSANECKHIEAVVVADVRSLTTSALHTLYLGRHILTPGQQECDDILYIVWSATTPCRVEEVRCHRICSGG